MSFESSVKGEVTLDTRAFDRAQDAYNLAKKKAVQTKTIVFVNNRPQVGAYPIEIRFPYSGKIIDIYVSVGKAGTSRTVLNLEKCSRDSYVSDSPVWAVAITDVILEANEKSSFTTSTPYTINDDTVAQDDHFRVNFTETGADTANLTVEVVVEI
jgi:hypothetical protein